MPPVLRPRPRELAETSLLCFSGSSSDRLRSNWALMSPFTPESRRRQQNRVALGDERDEFETVTLASRAGMSVDSDGVRHSGFAEILQRPVAQVGDRHSIAGFANRLCAQYLSAGIIDFADAVRDEQNMPQPRPVTEKQENFPLQVRGVGEAERRVEPECGDVATQTQTMSLRAAPRSIGVQRKLDDRWLEARYIARRSRSLPFNWVRASAFGESAGLDLRECGIHDA